MMMARNRISVIIMIMFDHYWQWGCHLNIGSIKLLIDKEIRYFVEIYKQENPTNMVGFIIEMG